MRTIRASFPSTSPPPFRNGSRRVDGTAVVRRDGRVAIGVAVHGMTPVGGTGGRDFLVVVDGDAGFAGTGSFDNDGDFKGNGPLTWTRVDCATIAVP